MLLSSQVENRLTPVNLTFTYISLQKFLNLDLILGEKIDGHEGTWAGCLELDIFLFFFLES